MGYVLCACAGFCVFLALFSAVLGSIERSTVTALGPALVATYRTCIRAEIEHTCTYRNEKVDAWTRWAPST